MSPIKTKELKFRQVKYKSIKQKQIAELAKLVSMIKFGLHMTKEGAKLRQ